MKDHVIFAFILAFLVSLLQTSFLTSFHFFALAPFLVIVYLNYRLVPSLWIATLTGFLLDLFSDHFFGFFGLSLPLITLVVYRLKRFCNYEKPLSVLLYTSFVSFIYSLVQPVLLFLFDKGLSLSIQWIFYDLLIMPLLDGVLALVLFVIPLKLYDLSKKQAKRLTRRF
jgi:rod shape-determining protein MreD